MRRPLLTQPALLSSSSRTGLRLQIRCSTWPLHRRFSSLLPPSSSSVVPTAPYDILFCGTDTFASASLSALLSHRLLLCSSLHVLTPADVAQKWGASRMKVSPVKRVALEHGLPHQDVPSSGMTDYIPPRGLVSDNPKAILLTCSFGHLIPDALLDAFPNPWQRINIHPSLLPQLRGAAPIQWALTRRMTTSGVSIQTLEKGKFDTGRIVSQQEFAFPPPIPQARAAGFLQVEQAMAQRAADLLIRTLQHLPERWANSWDQDETQKTYAPKLKAQHSLIKWHKWSAADIVAREQGFAYLYPLTTTLHPPTSTSSSPFRPVSITFSDTSTLTHSTLRSQDPAIAAAFLSSAVPAGSAGYSLPLNALVVKTQGEEALAVQTVKVASKKAKTAQEWYRAYRDRADPASGLLRFQ
ncbi:hypothetical protein EX895_000332 [Sporisorium graminicola]|uniref:methionyl-tRNA formyltransferase n=1 Tax=Sporisorium graminicola TaxID=280036 RepID=A0A4U7KZK4_9BASI|nr:hypothetical protein EX895_000332 [Sporisorium graminicola]TKY90334.1 hypothetical protein EX895_000332 [Sporisorium graminicola]